MDLEKHLSEAVKFFWETRLNQSKHQGGSKSKKDRGERSAVTGGKQLDGIVSLVSDLLIECELPDASIIRKRAVVPGFFRPTKEWDLLVVVDNELLAAIEFKSQVGPSFGNNFNNRTEEALGSATDILTAYRDGAFKPSSKPWLGYLFLLEATAKSTNPVRVDEPYFKVFGEFKKASYAKRYEQLCLRMVRERLYDSSCLIMSSRDAGPKGRYWEPSKEIGFLQFVTSLTSKINSFVSMRGK